MPGTATGAGERLLQRTGSVLTRTGSRGEASAMSGGMVEAVGAEAIVVGW